MKVLLWLDDYRQVNYFNKFNLSEFDKVIHIHNYSEAIYFLNEFKNNDIVISFDHDLDFNEVDADKTGYDVAKYIVENDIPLLYYTIHTMNPVGASNIRHLLYHYGYKEI